jgi:hypothetical protein
LEAVLIFFCGFKLSDLVSRNINETTELEKNNIAIALLIAVLAVSIVLLVEHGVTNLLTSFIYMPQTGKGFPVISIK